MRNVFIAIAFAASTVGLLGLTAQTAQADEPKICESYSALATAIMGARQSGTSMRKAWEIADGNKLAEALVIGAYDLPRYQSTRYQKRAITEFANAVFSVCIKAVREASV